MGSWNFGYPNLTDGVKVVHESCECGEYCDCYELEKDDIQNILDKARAVEVDLDIETSNNIVSISTEAEMRTVDGYYADTALDMERINIEIEIASNANEHQYTDPYLCLDDKDNYQDYLISESLHELTIESEIQKMIVDLYNYHINTFIQESTTTGWVISKYEPENNGEELLALVAEYKVNYRSNINK